MTNRYDASRATALRLIDKFGSGREATFYRITRTFDPLTGEEPTTEAEHEIKCVTIPEAGGLSRDGDRAAENQITIMVPAEGLAIVPLPGDQVALPQKTGRFVVQSPVKPLEADGDPIAFTVRLAKIGD
jgi:hypothetical protein